MTTNLTTTVEKKFSLIADSLEENIFTCAEKALRYYLGLKKSKRNKLRKTEVFGPVLVTAYNSQNGRPVEKVDSNLFAQVLMTLPMKERRRYLN